MRWPRCPTSTRSSSTSRSASPAPLAGRTLIANVTVASRWRSRACLNHAETSPERARRERAVPDAQRSRPVLMTRAPGSDLGDGATVGAAVVVASGACAPTNRLEADWSAGGFSDSCWAGVLGLAIDMLARGGREVGQAAGVLQRLAQRHPSHAAGSHGSRRTIVSLSDSLSWLTSDSATAPLNTLAALARRM
jgi:hypothetical protein